MKLTIKHQDSFSRGELLLRSFFGFIYIVLPHMFVLLFVSIWSCILTFISFWAILFTGRYPQSFFEFQVGLYRWNLRLSARIYNLSDGYPAFGVGGTDEYTTFEMPYPEKLSRGLAIVKLLFGGIYCALPHVFVWCFRFLWTSILMFLAWWVVLFTGKYPASWHNFNVGTLRWITRVNLYLTFMTDDYPPFSGKEDDEPASGQAASAPAPSAPAPAPTPEPTPAPEPAPAPAPEPTVTEEPAPSEPEPEKPRTEEPETSADDTTAGESEGGEDTGTDEGGEADETKPAE